MDHVYILGGLRSYIGVKDGMYRHIPAERLGAEVLREVVSRFKLPTNAIDYIIGGNAVGGGGNITRLAALSAGLPERIPAVTLDLQCGSALEAISAAAAKIESGLADLVIAGGMESSSVQPYRMMSPNHPEYDGGKAYTVAQFVPGKRGEQVMLEGAEETAIRENVPKEEMDAWVLRSHKRAAEARKEGILEDIAVSIDGSSRDEGIRPTMSQRLIDRLPYLLPNGTKITAANACLMHDGAAFVVLCSEHFLREQGRMAEYRFRFGTAIGDDPMMSPKSAVSAAKAMLAKTGHSYQEIDAFEVNEAFAVIDVLFERAFPGIGDRYNIWGGALAYGHPYGVSGAMILLHLMKALEHKNGRLGMCCVAAAGGIGSSILVERIQERPINTYLDALRAYPPEREALITEKERYTFGELIEAAESIRKDSHTKLVAVQKQESGNRRIHWIQEPTIASQLIQFLAYGDGNTVPVIAPSDVKISDELRNVTPPEGAYMGVMTSGTSGRQKVLFRSFESWHDFFSIQNEIFKMGEGSTTFMQGSLAFTGNLNLYMAQLASGGSIVAADSFDPRLWKRMIEAEHADCIYLIPVKLRALRRIYEREHAVNHKVVSFVSGSQSMGGAEAAQFKTVFPEAEITLYYGASELNYITYIRGSEMKEDTTLVGRVFPEVEVWIENDHFHVKTRYGILGIGNDAVIGDCGHTDADGMFYFDGRDDDICNINGRKVSSLRVEEAVRTFPGVAETAVKAVQEHGRDYLKAWIVWEKVAGTKEIAGEDREKSGCTNMAIREFLAERLADYEIPHEFVYLKEFPKTESGKIRKKEL